MDHKKIRFLFLNIGHFLDHFFMLIFASVAALQLTYEWNITYASLIPYATPGFVAFGSGAIIAGWIADKWHREWMIVIFFIGIGVSSLLSVFANSPFDIAISLTFIGLFASIYHPVGLAMIVQEFDRTAFPIAINGVFGNMGVASAALVSGFFIDNLGWKSAFVIPGLLSILIGIIYFFFVVKNNKQTNEFLENSIQTKSNELIPIKRKVFIRIFGIIIVTTALGGFIFQSTTFALPKIIVERLSNIADTATMVGWYAFLIFSLASIAQILIGYLIDNHSLRTVFAGIALLQCLFFSLMIHLSGIAALIVSIAFMLVVFALIPINDVLIGRIVHSKWRSRAYALRYVVTFSVMALTVPVIAWIHDYWGFSRLFEILSIIAFIVFIVVLLLPNLSDKK